MNVLDPNLYNAYLEGALMVFDGMLYLFLRLQNRQYNRKNQAFMRLVFLLILGSFFDCAACFSLNHPGLLAAPLMRALRALNGAFGPIVTYALVRYVLAYAEVPKNRVMDILLLTPLCTLLAVWFINPFTGLIIDYSTGGFGTHGPLYMTMFYYLPLLYLLLAVFTTVVYRKRYDRTQMIAFLCNIVFVIFLFLVQMLYMPYLMITYYIGSVAAYTMFFALETPAYDRLITAMRLLEDARAQADLSTAQAQTASRSKSDFLTNMSQEIRTPVNEIISLDGMILQKTREPRIQRYASDLRAAGMHLLDIINSILDYARMEAGQLILRDEPYETRVLLDDICMQGYTAAKEKDIAFYLTADDALPKRLIGDAERIAQIASALVSNAVKFTAQGSVNVMVSAGKEGDDCVLSLRVRDTGIGIEEAEIPKLFEAFSRVNLRQNRDISGTGLGLAITKRLVDALGGRIDVSSKPLSGSEFTVLVPQKNASEETLGVYDASVIYTKADAAARQRETDALDHFDGIFAGREFLVIDDAGAHLAIARSLLVQTGAKVDIGRSGKVCLDLARGKRYDAILLDYLMPEMDGLKTLQALRKAQEEEADFASKKASLIVMTADSSTGARRRFLEEGFDDYLAKPLTLKDLVEVLQKQLEEQ